MEIMEIDEMAICPGCGETKPLSEFNVSESRKSGYAYYCRTCDRRRATERARRMRGVRRYTTLFYECAVELLEPADLARIENAARVRQAEYNG